MTETPVTPVSDAESAMAFSNSAIVANRFFIHMGPWVRLTFAEQGPDSQPVFRSAVVLSHQDAIALKNVLGSMLAAIEKKLDETAESAGESHA